MWLKEYQCWLFVCKNSMWQSFNHTHSSIWAKNYNREANHLWDVSGSNTAGTSPILGSLNPNVDCSISGTNHSIHSQQFFQIFPDEGHCTGRLIPEVTFQHRWHLHALVEPIEVDPVVRISNSTGLGLVGFPGSEDLFGGIQTHLENGLRTPCFWINYSNRIY